VLPKGPVHPLCQRPRFQWDYHDITAPATAVTAASAIANGFEDLRYNFVKLKSLTLLNWAGLGGLKFGLSAFEALRTMLLLAFTGCGAMVVVVLRRTHGPWDGLDMPV
jgi:hypothetical protein